MSDPKKTPTPSKPADEPTAEGGSLHLDGRKLAREEDEDTERKDAPDRRVPRYG